MSKDTRLDEVTSLATKIRNGAIDNDTLYEFLLMGYKCFKSGTGLPTNLVYEAIGNSFDTSYDGVVGE